MAENSSYEGRYDFDTLSRAEEIKRDPKRMAGVKSHAQKHASVIKTVLGKI